MLYAYEGVLIKTKTCALKKIKISNDGRASCKYPRILHLNSLRYFLKLSSSI